uniref:Uncharacterized protein n=1 Tax=Cannabis sativa TaxID=3483 RepID=A0A803Q9D5_CANSA
MSEVVVPAVMYVVVVAAEMSVPPSSIDMGKLAEPAVMTKVVVMIQPYQSNLERKQKDAAAKFLHTCMDTVVHTCKGKVVEGVMVVEKAARVVVVDAEAVMSKIYACQMMSLNAENVQGNLDPCVSETVEALEWSTYS